MKILKVFSCITLIFVLTFSFFIPTYTTEVKAATAVTRYGKNLIPQMSNSAALNFVYERIVDGCATPEYGENIDITHPTYKINEKELRIVVDLVFADYPEYFWLTNGYSYSQSIQGNTISYITPKYVSFDGKTMTDNTQKSAKAELDRKVEQLTSDLHGKSQYEQALILHDRLAATTNYVYNDLDQTAYGALVKGEAVCAGYSKAYQLLLQKVGITSWYIRGNGKDLKTGTSESHAWNAVLLDGKWYYTDVTWDDKGTLYYAYLNLTSEFFDEEHIPNDGKDNNGQFCFDYKTYQPKATSTDANYHERHNSRFTSVDVNGFANVLKNNHPARIYITGNNKNITDQIKEKFRDIVTAMGNPTTVGYKYNVSYQGREYIITYEIIDSSHTHNPSLVPAVTPSCTKGGNSAYYTCSCGKWFKDSAAQNEIADKGSVKLSTTPHKDSNTDNKCDTCGLTLGNPNTTSSATQSSTPTVSAPSNSTPSSNTPSSSTPSGSTSSVSAPSNSTPSSNAPSYNTPSYNTQSYSTPSSNTQSYNPPSGNAATNSLVTLWLIIIILVVGGSIVAVIIFKK